MMGFLALISLLHHARNIIFWFRLLLAIQLSKYYIIVLKENKANFEEFDINA